MAAPPVQSRSVGPALVVPRTTAVPSWVACPCDIEVASPGQHLPRQAQRHAPLPPCQGLEHQAHTTLTTTNCGASRCATMPPLTPPPCHCPLAHMRTRGAGPDGTLQEDGSPFPGLTQAWRCLLSISASAGLGTASNLAGLATGRPGTPRPVESHREGSTNRGTKATRRGPNPTQPPNPLWLSMKSLSPFHTSHWKPVNQGTAGV